MGITNTRLSAAKRGIAIPLAQQLAAATGCSVCVVGADPTDRDVERRLPDFVAHGDGHSEMHLSNGTRELHAYQLPQQRLCFVSLPDRDAVEAVLPELRASFQYLVIDGPSRIGTGVGIASRLAPYLDLMLVTCRLTAEDLADARLYLEKLATVATAKHIDARVASTGDRIAGGLASHQIERRLALLPTIARLPSMWGRAASAADFDEAQLHAAFLPVVEWIRAYGAVPVRQQPKPAQTKPITAHVAASRYRELG